MATPEGRLKAEIRRLLTESGAFWSNVQGGPGSKPGDPDIIACYKGRYVGLEAKSKDGRQSPIQKVRESEIVNAGGIYRIIRTKEEVKEILEGIDNDNDKD